MPQLIFDAVNIGNRALWPNCHHLLVQLRSPFAIIINRWTWCSYIGSAIRPKLKCTKCGGKAVGLIYSPETSTNAYRKASQ